jgi:hypothetical protein
MSVRLLRFSPPLAFICAVWAPSGLRSTMVGVGVIATLALAADAAVRWDRAVLLFCGLLCSCTILAGLLLNLLPSGLTRVSWSISAACGSLALLSRRRQSPPIWRIPRLNPLSTAMAISACVLVGAALVLSNRGAQKADAAPLALWLATSPSGTSAFALSSTPQLVDASETCGTSRPRDLGPVDIPARTQTTLPRLQACDGKLVVQLLDVATHKQLRLVSTTS